jgi:outer membrane receptor protein involved in Fe transport
MGSIASSARRVAILCSLIFQAVPAAAQQTGRVVGRVTDAQNGAPIGEVQIFIPGTGLGTLTRQNGTFVMLEVPPGPQTVRAERIGMAPVTQQVTVPAGQAVEVNFQLSTQALGLDEIVVTGTAGAARRREVGNTIAQINVADIPSRPTQATDMLTAAAPGIKVTENGGEMGAGYQIKLRGNKSVSMANNPIVYIDGIRMQSKPIPNNQAAAAGTSGIGGSVNPNPLNTINPNDIERIEIIKGSAATTLYGTEASAGVIQIFTKRGAAGAAVWNLESNHNFAWLRKVAPEPHPYNRMDVFGRTGRVGSYTASVRGGGQALQYFASGLYEGGIGQFPQDTISRKVVRGNFTFTPINALNMQWNTSYNRQAMRNTPAGGNQNGIYHTANRGVANTFGSEDPEITKQLFTQEYRREIQRFTTGGTGTYTPIPNLTNRLTVGYDLTLQEIRGLRPFGFVFFNAGSTFNDTWSNQLLTFDYVGSYAFDVIEGVRSTFSWGGQTVGEESRRVNSYGETFPGAANPTVSSAATTVGYEDRSKIWNAGFFFQNVFDVRDRYFVTVGARVDGNSAFGSGFGLQVYPKASASWVLSDESFWNEGWGSMKVRIAYGQAGRAPGAFDAVRTWESQQWAGRPSLVPRNLGNPDIGPEVTAELEAGFDGEWFGGRLISAFTYYNQTTTDALFNVAQIPTTGFSNPQRKNVGKLSNRGMELSVQASPVSRANWAWDVGVDLTTNNSEVVSLGGIAPFATGGGWIQEGQPAPVLRGTYVRNPDAIAVPLASCVGVTDPSVSCLEANHIYGPTEPTRTVSPSTTIRLPFNISVSARGEYRAGHWVQDGGLDSGVTRGAWMPFCWQYYVNPYDGPSNNYRPPNETGHTLALKPDTPAKWRAMCTSTLSQASLTGDKGDFFRLRSVSAQLPLDFIVPDRITNAVLTVSLNNSWGWQVDNTAIRDPDMGSVEGLVEGPGTTTIPTPVTFNASLRVQF